MCVQKAGSLCILAESSVGRDGTSLFLYVQIRRLHDSYPDLYGEMETIA